MAHGHSLFLVSVGSLALSLCSVAARADSIPTVTATSVSLADHFAFSWTIAGDSFSLYGSGLPAVTLGTATPGQSLADADFGAYGTGRIGFYGTRGSSDSHTYGTVTLDGVTHSVELLGTAYLQFPTSTIYNPAILPPPPDSQATSGRAFSGPATVVGQPDIDRSSLEFQEIFCSPGEFSSPSCFGNVIANLNLDVPGIATLTGVNYPGEPSDSITNVEFTSTPEPVSYALTAAGIAAALLFAAFGRPSWKNKS